MSITHPPCPCGSDQTFANCCEPLITGTKQADSAEALMRSRYSAYASGHYRYIADTYASEQQTPPSAAEIASSDTCTEWLKLVICATPAPDQVEFKAYYRDAGQIYLLHERSSFIQQDGLWRYLDGHIFADSGAVQFGRNDPCICGSGKKYKKCCGAAT